MLLFLDGARLGYGLMAETNDITLADLAKYTDVFYIGGTKVGALFGEAVVITNPGIEERFSLYDQAEWRNAGKRTSSWYSVRHAVYG